MYICRHKVINVRSTWADTLKVAMIYLVVLGHIGGYDPEVQKVIYSFHMPVFIFLSGFLTSLDKGRKEQDGWLRRTFLIYAGAQAGHILLTLVINCNSSYLHKTPLDVSFLNWRVFIVPQPILWYLVSLIIWRLSAWRILRFCYRKSMFSKTYGSAVIVSVSLILALAGGFVPLDGELSFQRTFAFLPFFVLGVVFKKENLMHSLEKIPAWVAALLLLFGFYAAYIFPWSYQPNVHYADIQGLFVRMMQTALGLVLCLSVLRLFQIKTGAFSFMGRICTKLAGYGRYTLWIYIGHSFLNRFNGYVIAAAGKVIPGFEMNLMFAVILALFYCIVCIGAARLFQKRSLIL